MLSSPFQPRRANQKIWVAPPGVEHRYRRKTPKNEPQAQNHHGKVQSRHTAHLPVNTQKSQLQNSHFGARPGFFAKYRGKKNRGDGLFPVLRSRHSSRLASPGQWSFGRLCGVLAPIPWRSTPPRYLAFILPKKIQKTPTHPPTDYFYKPKNRQPDTLRHFARH